MSLPQHSLKIISQESVLQIRIKLLIDSDNSAINSLYFLQ